MVGWGLGIYIFAVLPQDDSDAQPSSIILGSNLPSVILHSESQWTRAQNNLVLIREEGK